MSYSKNKFEKLVHLVDFIIRFGRMCKAAIVVQSQVGPYPSICLKVQRKTKKNSVRTAVLRVWDGKTRMRSKICVFRYFAVDLTQLLQYWPQNTHLLQYWSQNKQISGFAGRPSAASRKKAHRAQEQGCSVSFGKSLAFCFQWNRSVGLSASKSWR